MHGGRYDEIWQVRGEKRPPCAGGQVCHANVEPGDAETLPFPRRRAEDDERFRLRNELHFLFSQGVPGRAAWVEPLVGAPSYFGR